MSEADRVRRMAESFGTDAERYDRAWPGYPETLVDRVIAASPGREVLDVGRGTGIAARQFSGRPVVHGVEPDPRRAAFARACGIEVEVAACEAWDLAGRGLDAVLAARSRHWVDPVRGAAKPARVLRPGGRLALFGHVFEPPAEMAQAFSAAINEWSWIRRSTAIPRGAVWISIRRCMPSSPTRSETPTGSASRGSGRFDWRPTYTRDHWLDVLATTGGLTQVSPGQLAEVLDVVGAVIDSIGGRFTMPYTTLATTAAREDPA